MTGEELRLLREGLGLSQSRFAEFIGLSGVHSNKLISDWETEKRPITGVAAVLLDFIDRCDQTNDWPDFVLNDYPEIAG